MLRRWKSEDMLLQLVANRSADLGMLITIPEGHKIGRRTEDSNIQDFQIGGKNVAWFTTDPIPMHDASETLTEARGILPIKPSLDDDMEACLEPYNGQTRLYKLTRLLVLWDMSKRQTVEHIRKLLPPEDQKQFDLAFKWDEGHEAVVRRSKFDNDMAVFEALKAHGAFDMHPGWYHPTMLAFNGETNIIESVQRREIVLFDPQMWIGKLFEKKHGSRPSAPTKEYPLAKSRIANLDGGVRRGALF